MNKKLKFKGSMKQFMRWPLYLTILLIWLDILIFMISVKAGILATLGIVVYIVAALLLTRFHRPLILNDLIAFANQYESLEKRLLDDLALPYAIMDTNGRMIWSNKVFAELTGKEQLYNKHITTIFPEITPDKLPVPEKQEITEMSTNFGDRIYRVSMQLVTMKDVVNEARILENVDADINLVAMFFYDETELQEYIQKNEDDKLVVALAYLDNYEEALEGVEEVRRSLLIALIDRKITKYFSNFDGLVRKLERDKYFLIMRQSSLETLKEQRFHTANSAFVYPHPGDAPAAFRCNHLLRMLSGIILKELLHRFQLAFLIVAYHAKHNLTAFFLRGRRLAARITLNMIISEPLFAFNKVSHALPVWPECIF